MYYILTLITVACAVFFIASSFTQFRRRPRLRYIEGVSPIAKTTFRLSSLKILRPLLRFMRPMTELPYFKKLQYQSDILKINLDLEMLIIIKFVLGLALGFIVFRLFSSSLYGFAAAAAGFFAPDMMFLNKVKAKKEDIVRMFPETIDLIDLCIGAGLDFPSSVKWVVDKSMYNPFLEQLMIVLNEIHVGRNRVDALKDMARRLQLPDVSSFVRTVVQAERMGTSVEEGFRNLSEDTRMNRFQEGERYAIKASLKILFPLLFCILPVILIVVAGPIVIKFTQGELIPKSATSF